METNKFNDNWDNHPVQMTIKTVAGLTLGTVAIIQMSKKVRTKLADRKARKTEKND